MSCVQFCRGPRTSLTLLDLSITTFNNPGRYKDSAGGDGDASTTFSVVSVGERGAAAPPRANRNHGRCCNSVGALKRAVSEIPNHDACTWDIPVTKSKIPTMDLMMNGPIFLVGKWNDPS
jgi:hypothetical protein